MMKKKLWLGDEWQLDFYFYEQVWGYIRHDISVRST